MSVAIRRPDVATLYPTRTAFERVFGTPAVPASGTAAPAGGAATLSRFAGAGVSGGRARRRPKALSLHDICGCAAPARHTAIVSEFEGRVTRLLFTVPKNDGDLQPGVAIDTRLERHYRRLFEVFATADVVVVGDPLQRAPIEKMRERVNASGRLDFVESPKFQLSVWAQDAYIALNNPKRDSILVEGVSFRRFDDMTIADDVAAQTDVAAWQSPLYFQGGNILGGNDVTLIGVDYVAINAGRFNLPDQAAVEAEFAKLFKTPVLTLGGANSGNFDMRREGIVSGGHQPIFHIDMYVTLTGVTDRATGKDVVFLGRPAMAKKVTGHYSDIDPLDTSVYDGLFEETADQLAQHFTVRHLPLWITHGNLRGPNNPLKYYNLTWNNAIVENDGGHRRVYLPRYSSTTDAKHFGVDLALRTDLDQAAGEAWLDLGFEVVWSDGVEDLAWGDGVVHCMTKTLRRTRRSSAKAGPRRTAGGPT